LKPGAPDLSSRTCLIPAQATTFSWLPSSLPNATIVILPLPAPPGPNRLFLDRIKWRKYVDQAANASRPDPPYRRPAKPASSASPFGVPLALAPSSSSGTQSCAPSVRALQSRVKSTGTEDLQIDGKVEVRSRSGHQLTVVPPRQLRDSRRRSNRLLREIIGNVHSPETVSM